MYQHNNFRRRLESSCPATPESNSFLHSAQVIRAYWSVFIVFLWHSEYSITVGTATEKVGSTPSSRVVSVLDSGAEGPGFKSQP